MKSLQYLGPKQLQFEDVPKPEIAADEVLLKIRKVGICGTDLHIYNGGMKVPTPLIMGHEFVGNVVEVGKNVSEIKVGDRAVAEHVIGCGKCCYCGDGKKNLCETPTVIGLQRPGALAEYLAVPANLVFVLPDSLSYDDGVLVEPLSIAVYGVRRANVQVGDVVAVIGQGPIGLFIDQVAQAAGALVYGVDIMEDRLHYAKSHRLVDGVINTKEDDAVKKFAEMTQKCGADITFEAVGQEATAECALSLTKPNGRMVVLGVFEHEVKLNMMYVVKKEIEIIGSWTCLNSFEPTINLLASKHVKTDGMITHRYKFDDAIKAFEDSAAYSGNRIKTVIEF